MKRKDAGPDPLVTQLMMRLEAMAEGNSGGAMTVILEFMALRPPYRQEFRPAAALAADDPRRMVFEAQLTYILNTGGMMFILTPLPLKSIQTGTGGAPTAQAYCGVYAVRFQSGRWFPVPADQIPSHFVAAAQGEMDTLWLYRRFPTA